MIVFLKVYYVFRLVLFIKPSNASKKRVIIKFLEKFDCQNPITNEGDNL